MSTSLVTIGISKNNLVHNLREYQHSYPRLIIAPVIKSNAYGHGLLEVAQILDREQVPFLVVNSLDEATQLRGAKIRAPILIAGYIRTRDIVSSLTSNTAIAITDIEELRELSPIVQESVRLHIKIDTGMHRQGILPSQSDEVIALINAQPLFNVEGICTHLADADGENSTFTDAQVETWNKTSEKFDNSFTNIKYRHIAATTGFEFARQTTTNMARLGIGLYGFDVSKFGKMNLKPVLEVRSIVASIRTIGAGESVGYSATFTARRETMIATIPGGYFEGIDRRLSNKGFVTIKGKICPIVGRVSMNMIGVDVTDAPETAVGDDVILMSRNPKDQNSVASIAHLIGTIPYEILVHIPEQLPRITDVV